MNGTMPPNKARHFNGTSIRDIKNTRTRDLLRGLLAKTEEANPRTTFSNLMSSLTAADLSTVDGLLRNDPLFTHVNLHQEFPISAPPFFGTEDLVFCPGADLRAAYIIFRASLNSDAITRALQSLDLISQSIFHGSDEDVVASFEIYFAQYGHSLCIARKLAFVLGHWDKDTECWRMAAKIFATYGSNSRNYGMMALADSIGAEFSYLDIKSGFEHFSSLQPRSTISRKISYLSFRPITFSPEVAREGIAASYNLSLLDAVLYILCHRDLGVMPSDIRFHPDIEEAWATLQPARYGLDLFFRDEKSHADLRAFRASPAFLEYEAFRNFRASTQRLYASPDMRARDLTGISTYESKFYGAVATVSDLLPTQSESFNPMPSIFDNATAGVLSRSCGLVKVAERDPDFSKLTREDIGGLMGLTTEIDRLLSTSTLRVCAKSADDPFVGLILKTLLRAHSPSTKDSYQFKDAFQTYVLNYHNGDISSFIESVHQLNPEIVPYFVHLLDETMLSQMPFLVQTAEDVYETRAKVLEWFAEISGDQSSRYKAKQLRIDRKIAAVRGHINETRLNIDALRFRQWIDSTKLSDFSGLMRQEAFTMPLGLEFRGKKALSELKLTAHRDPNARALLAVMDCYREFCVNPDFGVASYLGRRIRHGTLRGTLLDALPDPVEFRLGASLKAQYETWVETFRKSIEAITARLHFAGKGAPSGAVISAEIDNKDKWEILLVCLRTMHEKSQADQGTASQIIEQYCWYIFEVELRDVQSAVSEARSEFGIFKMKYTTLEKNAIGFEKAVNIALGDRFNTVASWFHKPPNISPVAEISDIVEVVLQETRAEFPDFNPAPHLIVTKSKLSGGVYYYVYDALSVIVRNAGKHGDYPGILKISAQVDERDLGRTLTMNVVSRTKPSDSGAKAVARMKKAGLGGPIGADVIEGLSGVRKLHKMLMDKALLDFKYRAIENSPFEIQVSVEFLLAGIAQ